MCLNDTHFLIVNFYIIAFTGLTSEIMFDIIDKMKKITPIIISVALAGLCLVGCGSVTPDREVHNDENAIAEVTLYSTGERGKVEPGLVACGHAYVSIHNTSNETIVLGKGYELPEGATVTIASWEFDAHAGVWFNIEPTYIEQGWFVERKSITRAVDRDAMDRIDEYLKKTETDKWTLTNNCTHFASRLWNAAADGEVDDVAVKAFPSKLEKEVMRFRGSEKGRPHASDLPIGYFSGNTFVEFKLEK